MIGGDQYRKVSQELRVTTPPILHPLASSAGFF